MRTEFIAFGLIIIVVALIFVSNPFSFIFITIPLGLIGFFIFLFGLLFSEPKIVVKKEEPKKIDRYCPECGRAIPFDANICPYCGKRFRSEITESMVNALEKKMEKKD